MTVQYHFTGLLRHALLAAAALTMALVQPWLRAVFARRSYQARCLPRPV